MPDLLIRLREAARRDHMREIATKHGYAGRNGQTPTYRSWMSMVTRCRYPHFAMAKNYARRGVTVCERWDKSFAAFLADMGERPTDAAGAEPSREEKGT